MSIKIIPREKVYFRDWVEKNGIEVEVREISDSKWIATIVNVKGPKIAAEGRTADFAVDNLQSQLGQCAVLYKGGGDAVAVPTFEKQTAADRDVKKYAEITIKELERARKAWPYSPFPMYPGSQPMPMPQPYKTYGRECGSVTVWGGEVKRPCGCTAPCKCMGS